MFEKRYIYSATLDRVIDGDTIDVVVDLGFKISHAIRLRLAGLDAPEKRGSEREEGLAVAQYLHDFLEDSDALMIKTQKTGKYGRYIAEIWVEKNGEWINVNEWLISNGYAVKY